MERNADKFWLLMWKNCRIQSRNFKQTAIEILAPVLFSALLVLIRSLIEIEDYTKPTIYKEFDINNNTDRSIQIGGFPYPFPYVAYSPKGKLIDETMKNLDIPILPVGLENSKKLEDFLNKNGTMYLTLCGIQFDDNLANADVFPSDINVIIRFPGESRKPPEKMSVPLNWRTNFVFPIYTIPGPRIYDEIDGGYPAGYHGERFDAIQHYVSMSIIRQIKNTSEPLDPVVKLQRFPYPPYVEDPLLQALTSFISMVIMLSFVYTCLNTVKVITNEKENQVKEVLKIMGLPNWLHWLAWFIKSAIFLLVSVTCMVVLLKVKWLPGRDVSVFTNSDASVIFVFMCLYMCTIITFCFMISAFYSKANTASTIAGLFWFLSYTPYMFLQTKYETLSLATKLCMCLCSNSAMAFGFQFMLMFEGTSQGLQWEVMWKRPIPDDPFVLGHVMIMLIVDTLLYLLVTLYVEAIYPGEYGIPQPWYFPVTRKFWCRKRHTRASVNNAIAIASNHSLFGTNHHSDVMEVEPNLTPGIQIQALRKVFTNKKVAVRGLNLNMYEGQITALLGHNGAGKSTTMYMLTGIYPPTSGTAIICGNDIRTDMPKVRASLGLCPQHNVLFDELTVKEHLYFFGKLKGLKKNDIKLETDKYIKLLDLEPKRNSKAGTLSGGMKRKLSVGIALCGNSKVVILDEPTAGMDPAARRAIWDILQAEKKGRTLVLTTHFMDEADLLGDRIAIMAGGTLQCCGTSFFLKKKYGAGYRLTLEKASNCNVIKITELLRKYIPNIQVHTNVGSELTYRLATDQLPVFEIMLGDLEEQAKLLGVLNYGISLTTLEEIFMKVGADHGQEEQQNDLERTGKPVNDSNFTNHDLEFNGHSSSSRLDLGDNLLTGSALYRNQFKAMMMKKAYSSMRSWVLTLIQLILPVIFLILAILIVRSMHTNADLPPLDITLDSYDRPITVMDGNATYAKQYKEYVRSVNHKIVDLGRDKTFTDEILERAVENLPVVRQRYIVGASFINDTIIGWFNNIPFHSVPLCLNLIHNAILRKEVGTNYSIRVTNFPLPYTIDTKLQHLQDTNGTGFQLAFNMGFSFSFVASFYILFCVRERVCKAKHLQFVSGVNVFMFWISAYLFDFVHYIITALCLIITLAAFQEDGFSSFDELARIFSVFVLFGFAMLPLTYLASFLFNIPSSGYTFLTFINVFSGCFCFLIVVILRLPQLDLAYVGDGLDWFFILIPHYSVSSSIFLLNNLYSVNSFCKSAAEMGINTDIMCQRSNQCCSDGVDYYSWRKESIGRNMFFFAVDGVVFFMILLSFEYRLPHKIMYLLRSNVLAPPDVRDEDDDVANERHKIKNASEEYINSHSLMTKDLSKYYKNHLAVNKLSVGVKKAECFGLLGINGAGKTSTFKMLTGDATISYGDAWVNGLSLKTQMKQVHRVIGYCPQFDALLGNLTGRETMTLFCLLRGIPHREIKFICEKLAVDFSFQRHLDKKIKEYSGGNKRKLSTAVALIGDPCVVYLDEPSTGMDPSAKRMLWNGLCKVRDSGKCIVLTSHSMEECEALCTRIGIMVNGNFKCLGSPQHLKSKFSEGYTLTVKVKKRDTRKVITQEEIKPIDAYIKLNFRSAVLKETYQELLTYYIPEKNIPWSKMFGIMEKGKMELNIEDYSLGQSSLEQVFLNFTKHQAQ